MDDPQDDCRNRLRICIHRTVAAALAHTLVEAREYLQCGFAALENARACVGEPFYEDARQTLWEVRMRLNALEFAQTSLTEVLTKPLP